MIISSAPNQSPTVVGACSSAVAVHVASRRWLSSLGSKTLHSKTKHTSEYATTNHDKSRRIIFRRLFHLRHCHHHLRFALARQICQLARKDGSFAGHHRPEAERRSQAVSDFAEII